MFGSTPDEVGKGLKVIADRMKNTQEALSETIEIITDSKLQYTMKGNSRISTYGTPANFTCQKCKGSYAYYSFEDKEMVCTECHHIEKIEAKDIKCGRCETIYKKFTWFDPDCCPNCRKSFVD